jgi:phosphotransferase system HPr (HPr) family protein
MEEVVTTVRSRSMPENTTATRTLTVTHIPGLHARPCLAIVNTVRRFHSKVQLRKGKETVDAGEILYLMSLGVPAGTEVTLTATGPDANEALDALVQLFQNNFGFAD